MSESDPHVGYCEQVQMFHEFAILILAEFETNKSKSFVIINNLCLLNEKGILIYSISTNVFLYV
jgi:hypothetical protein